MLKWITVTIVLEELWLVIKYYTCYIISCSYFGGFYAVLGLAGGDNGADNGINSGNININSANIRWMIMD